MDRSIVRAVTLAMVLCVALGAAACSPSGDVTIGEADAGKKVTLSVGGRMEVELASNPTTGYSWQVADDAGGIVPLSGEPKYVQDPGPDMPGKGGAERFTFEAGKAGSGTLVLEYRRPWEKDVEPVKTFEVPVEVR